MTQTRVVHVKDNVEGAVYIGRHDRLRKGSPYANPFRIGNADPETSDPMTRTDVILQFVQWIKQMPDLIALLPELRGKPLACWCRHDGEAVQYEWNNPVPINGCHGDVLIDLLNEYTDDQLRNWQ